MQPTVRSELTQTKLSRMVTHADPKSTLPQISRVMTIWYLSTESRPAATSRRNRVKAIKCFCGLKKKRQLRKLWHSSFFSLCVLSPLKKKRKKKNRKASLPPGVASRCPEQAAAALHNQGEALSCREDRAGWEAVTGASVKTISLTLGVFREGPDELTYICSKHPVTSRWKRNIGFKPTACVTQASCSIPSTCSYQCLNARGDAPQYGGKGAFCYVVYTLEEF